MIELSEKTKGKIDQDKFFDVALYKLPKINDGAYVTILNKYESVETN